MKKLLFSLPLFLIVLALWGCSSAPKGYKSANDRLMNMKGYRADTEIAYISQEETTVYKAIQTASGDGRYKIVTYYPENFKDNAILFDGKMIWHYNPNIENKISLSAEDKPERSQLILFSFMENYVKSTDTAVTTAKTDGSLCTVLEAQIEGAGKYLASEKLWINNETCAPQRLVIYDSDGRERITVTFSSFEYDPVFDENEFTPQK